MNPVQKSSSSSSLARSFGSLVSIALILFCLIDPINNHVHRRRHVITDGVGGGGGPTAFGKRLKRLEPLTTVAGQTLQPSETTISVVTLPSPPAIMPGALEPTTDGSDSIYINHLPVSTTATMAVAAETTTTTAVTLINMTTTGNNYNTTTAQISTDATTTVSPAATTLVPPPTTTTTTGNSATTSTTNTFSLPIIDHHRNRDHSGDHHDDDDDPPHNHHYRNIRNRTGTFFRRKPLFIRDHCEELKHFIRNFRHKDHEYHHGVDERSANHLSEMHVHYDRPKEVHPQETEIRNETIRHDDDDYSNVTTTVSTTNSNNTVADIHTLASDDGDDHEDHEDQVARFYADVDDDDDSNGDGDDDDGDHTVSESINTNRYVVAYDHPYPTAIQEKILRQPKLVDNLMAMSNELPPLTAALPMEYLHEANALHPDHHHHHHHAEQHLNPLNHLKSPDSDSQHLFNTATLMEGGVSHQSHQSSPIIVTEHHHQQQPQPQQHLEQANIINEPPHSHEHHKIPAHYFESIVSSGHPIAEPHPEIHLVAQNGGGGPHGAPVEQQIIHPTPEQQQHALEQALIMVNHLKHHQQQHQQQQHQPGLVAHPVQLEQSIPIALDHVANVDGDGGLAIQAQLHHQQHHHTIHHGNYLELIGPQHLANQGVANVVDKAAHLSAALGILEGEEHSPPQSYDPTEHIPGIPGKPWKDYPIYSSVPKTSFHCSIHNPGYYADVEAGCQVWHYCQPDGRHDSFLCANGTLFNQKTRVCDWWHNVDCKSSIHYYGVNHDLYAPADHHHHHQEQHPSQILVQPLPTILTHNAEQQIHLIKKKKK